MLNQLMPQQALCSVLEIIVNQALALNIHGVAILSKLEQKTLSVNLTELGFPLSFSINQQEVLVSTLTERSDCTIDTSIKTLLDLKKEQQITELIKQEKLDVYGDIKIAQQFANIAESLEIDWGSELAKHIGDIPAFKLTQLQRFIGNKLRFASNQIQADSSEWLLHEKKLLITHSQIDDFKQQVEKTSQATNRLSNRICLLLAHQTND